MYTICETNKSESILAYTTTKRVRTELRSLVLKACLSRLPSVMIGFSLKLLQFYHLSCSLNSSKKRSFECSVLRPVSLAFDPLLDQFFLQKEIEYQLCKAAFLLQVFSPKYHFAQKKITNKNPLNLTHLVFRCWGQVGYRRRVTLLSMGDGCEFDYVMMHELGHTIGFYHEHQRADRNEFVEILWDNVMNCKKICVVV